MAYYHSAAPHSHRPIEPDEYGSQPESLFSSNSLHIYAEISELRGSEYVPGPPKHSSTPTSSSSTETPQPSTGLPRPHLLFPGSLSNAVITEDHPLVQDYLAEAALSVCNGCFKFPETAHPEVFTIAAYACWKTVLHPAHWMFWCEKNANKTKKRMNRVFEYTNVLPSYVICPIDKEKNYHEWYRMLILHSPNILNHLRGIYPWFDMVYPPAESRLRTRKRIRQQDDELPLPSTKKLRSSTRNQIETQSQPSVSTHPSHLGDASTGAAHSTFSPRKRISKTTPRTTLPLPKKRGKVQKEIRVQCAVKPSTPPTPDSPTTIRPSPSSSDTAVEHTAVTRSFSTHKKFVEPIVVQVDEEDTKPRRSARVAKPKNDVEPEVRKLSVAASVTAPSPHPSPIASPSSPTKRKRGRPRKHPLPGTA